MNTEAPWYWDYASYDHSAAGLVTCRGPNSLVHYANVHGRAACGQKVKDPRLTTGPIVIATCRNCCALARGPNRARIVARELRPLISGASRTNFIRREQGRKTQ